MLIKVTFMRLYSSRMMMTIKIVILIVDDDDGNLKVARPFQGSLVQCFDTPSLLSRL